MTVTITEHGDVVELVYEDADGNKAKAEITGLPKSVVEENAESIVENHSLKAKAEAMGAES